MKCPSCGHNKSYVKDSRKKDNGEETWIVRRRECALCTHRWTTREQFQTPVPDKARW